MFERANTFHALDRAATVIGEVLLWGLKETSDNKKYHI
jgi:hypothetical protein